MAEPSTARSVAAQNMELMQTLDDAWNARDLETSRSVTAGRRGSLAGPTANARPARSSPGGSQFFIAFPDQHLDNRPYKVFFASGDWTCSIAHFAGTFTGAIKGPDGKVIPPTGKSFEVDICTVAEWHDGQIVEENLFYDLLAFMKQIGLSE